MPVETKLFVATPITNIAPVMQNVIEKLNFYIRKELANYAKKHGVPKRSLFVYRANKPKHVKFTNGISKCETSDFRYFVVNFMVHGEDRRLFTSHICSNSHKEIYDGEKIIFSLNAWGRSEEIMMVVYEAVKEFGDCYYTANDASLDFQKLS